jgi:hypothetical protein
MFYVVGCKLQVNTAFATRNFEMNSTKVFLFDRFSEKLASLIDSWESQNKLVSNVKNRILKSFQRDLELFEDQIKRIEGEKLISLSSTNMRHSKS